MFILICIILHSRDKTGHFLVTEKYVKISSNKEPLLKRWIILLIINSYLPHDSRFLQIHSGYSLKIQGSSCTLIWILWAKMFTQPVSVPMMSLCLFSRDRKRT